MDKFIKEITEPTIKKPQDTKMVTMPLKEFQEEIEYNKKIAGIEKSKEVEEFRIKPLVKRIDHLNQEQQKLLYFLRDFAKLMLPNKMAVEKLKKESPKGLINFELLDELLNDGSNEINKYMLND